MARVPGDPFRDRLAGLDPATLTAFVAAVYDARGWAVTDEGGDGDGHGHGDTLVWPPGAERPRRLAVHAGDDPAVTLHDDAGDDATTLDVADLRRMVRYALDDEDWTRLCHEFFECDPGAVALSTPSAATDTGETGRESTVDDGDGAGDEPRGSPDAAAVARTDGEEGDDGTAATWSTTRVVAAGLAVALVVAGVAAVGPALTSSAGPGAGGSDGAEAGADREAEGSTTTTRPATTPNVMDREGRPVAPGVIKMVTVPGPRPPGVDTDGIENASALVDAHEAALSNRSYRLAVDHREYLNGTPTGVVRERTVVESPARYRSDIQWIGVVEQDPPAVGETSTYADGRGLYVRLSDEPGAKIITYADSDRDRFARRTASYLRETVAGSDSRIADAVRRDGTTWIWLTIGRDDAVGSLLVDGSGLVHELHYEYTHQPSDGPPVRVEVTMRVTPANVTTTPPQWVDSR